jgi:DNA mismatch endonuclease (patch repair protein)
MADMFSASKRSEIMAKVKGRENRLTELRLIEVFRERKIRGWRRRARVFGNPDFIFPQARLAIFVDGCFWHNCPLHGSVPASNQLFWMAKLRRNKMRDQLVNRELRRAGWSVLRIWQHELRDTASVAGKVRRSLTRATAQLQRVA